MAKEAQTSPSTPFPTAGLGPCELSCSHSTTLNFHQWVFWSTFCNGKVHCGKPRAAAAAAAATADSAVIKKQIIRFLQLLMQTIYWKCVVQFWGTVKIGDKTYLTTCDQPFAFRYFTHRDVRKLCEYRKHCLDYLIPVDDEEDEVQLIIGPPGRVFRSGFPEHAPDVGDYTSREYPQRDYAVDRVMGYWALPIYYHLTRHLPISKPRSHINKIGKRIRTALKSPFPRLYT
ncbi:protein NLP3-like [Coffea arabica]|uniref:Protein NLP3-like n=1 Tax=Coffea arabica TaxID=13443 RepID=A0A6P6TKL9_COFAR|nr:protein NLP3-like [Coffea arabica]